MDGDAEGALHPEAHGGTVLVVDDHPINRLVAVRSLATMGYRVLDASDTRAAADLIEAERIDACLLDVHMPDEDGIAFTNRLRRGELGPAGRTLPVIAFTADLLTQTHDLCRAAGMLGVIHKPMSPARLAEGVAHAVSAGRRVLVVDDDATNRVILSRMLEHLGVDVHVADSQRSALERLAEGPYRYIILDEHLGDGTGHEVVTALRSLEVPWRRVPVISSTATSVDQGRERVYDDALPKPIELVAVAKIVERWGPPPLPSTPSG